MNKPYREGDIVKIKEDVQAHDGWKGEKIEIVDTNPPNETVEDKFEFKKVDDEYGKIWSCFRFDEIELLKPMMECGHRGLYNDSKKRYFCPWCK